MTEITDIFAYFHEIVEELPQWEDGKPPGIVKKPLLFLSQTLPLIVSLRELSILFFSILLLLL